MAIYSKTMRHLVDRLIHHSKIIGKLEGSGSKEEAHSKLKIIAHKNSILELWEQRARGFVVTPATIKEDKENAGA